ncbi:MAG: hypothetical protein ACYCZJ_11890 [Sulfuriferula sp.]
MIANTQHTGDQQAAIESPAVGGVTSRIVGEVTKSSSLSGSPVSGDLLATARNNAGSPTAQRLPTTTIELEPGNPGSRTSLATAELLGMVTRNAAGEYVAVGKSLAGEPEAAQGVPGTEQEEGQEPQGPELFSESEEESFNASLSDIPQPLYDQAVISAAMQAATTGDIGDFSAKLAADAGLDVAQVRAVQESGTAMFQAQADKAISGLGVDPRELYDWARSKHPDQLQAAVRNQVTARDLSGYRELAKQYLDHTAPDGDTLKAHGYETRQTPPTHDNPKGADLVFVHGTWMEAKTAARIGLI